MSVFNDAGNARLLAAEGSSQMAELMLAGLKAVIADFKAWLGNMPVTLPPTESTRR